MHDEREIKVQIFKKKGKGRQGGYGYKLYVPTSWAKTMEITQEDNIMIAVFDGEKITIQKKHCNEKI